MNIRSLLAFSLPLCSAIALLPSVASAQNPLNRATIQNLRNKVDLTVKEQRPRPAQKADTMTPGDALRTHRSAMAELRFNDNSLARLGEQALFQFAPNSRNFDLKQGTVLLFITPGQGRTRVRTPNAAAGIRGSALFVRYIPDSKVTLIGALTNSDIEVSNGSECNSAQSIALKAGQLGYVFNCQIGIYNFDLKKFQETSPLFKEAKLDQNPEVKAEIVQALTEQGAFVANSESNPAWTKLADNRQPTPVASVLDPTKLLVPSALNPAIDSSIVSQWREGTSTAATNPSVNRPPDAIVQMVQPAAPPIQPAPFVAPSTPVVERPPEPIVTPVTPVIERPSVPVAPPITAPSVQVVERPALPVAPPAPVIPPANNLPTANAPVRPAPPVAPPQIPVTPPTAPVTPVTPPAVVQVTPPPTVVTPPTVITPPTVVTPPPTTSVVTPPAPSPTPPMVTSPPNIPPTPPGNGVGATPAVPAIPASPANPGNSPANVGGVTPPATPATPAVPAIPPTVAPPTAPAVVTTPPIPTPTATTVNAPTPVATTPASPPIVDAPILQPAPAPPAAAPPTTTPVTPTPGVTGTTPVAP